MSAWSPTALSRSQKTEGHRTEDPTTKARTEGGASRQRPKVHKFHLTGIPRITSKLRSQPLRRGSQ